MTLRQLHLLATLLDREASRTVTTLQVLESIDRYSASARRELQETRFLLGVPAPDGFPEVLDDEIRLCVAAVVGVLLPVVDVNVGNTTDEELELALVEDIDEVGWNELVEASDEGVELLFDSLLDSPLRYEPSEMLVTIQLDSSVMTYSTYSFLFSFVTSMSLPPSLSSTVTFSPKRSSSTENVL